METRDVWRVWQARRASNPQPAVLETAALPIELLAFRVLAPKSRENIRSPVIVLCITLSKILNTLAFNDIRSIWSFNPLDLDRSTDAIVVLTIGFEPMTSSLPRKRSTG